MQAAAVAGFTMLLWVSAQRTSRVFERLNTNHLLTTIPTREAALGVVVSVYSQVIPPFSLPVLSAAVGFAIGTQSLASTLTIVVAVVAFVALAVLFGIVMSLAAKLATIQSPRLRRYRNGIYILAYILVFIVWIAVIQGPISDEFIVELLRRVPVAWFVDLALLPTPEIQTGVARSVGALCVTIVGVPVLASVAISLATRVWNADPISATEIHRSRSLVGDGFVERLFAGLVSRPVLTVARKRWLIERRVPLGLMMAGYLIILLPSVFLPAFAVGEIPGISLVSFAFICAVGTGFAFGTTLLGGEYQSLQMTLTTVSGKEFIRGAVLAGVALGGPITAAGMLILGVGSSIGILETLLLAFSGVVLCVSSTTIAAAISMRVSYYEFQLTPIPFTDATAYEERGLKGFINLGLVLALVGLVCLPVFVSYGLMFFNSSVATVLNIPITVMRITSLILTVFLAGGVSVVAYRRAIRSYNQYTLP
ncbi:hypothetical protein PNP85_03680 [Halobacterium salinarum]|uniref:hypothetical protein n=1 Tax=Halobacterium salinarum TaxID=2242 RepID=UPI0025569A40|nr:hypothetical protein [Halobacterium salinarum]MDL0138609.1 hypothetical protein [Halobacterium salinarum]